MMQTRIPSLVFCLLLGGLVACHGAPPPAPLWDGMPEDGKRQRIVQEADLALKTHRLPSRQRKFPYDCSGFVGSVLLETGIDVFGGASVLNIRGNGVTIIHKFVSRYGEVFQVGLPSPGDLVFFSNTWDRNRDRKLNDKLTHIGIVESVDPDETVTVIHHLGGRFRRDVMNLRHPHTVRNARGKKLNSYLRRKRRADPKGTPYLAAGLFDGFGSLIPRPVPSENPTETP